MSGEADPMTPLRCRLLGHVLYTLAFGVFSCGRIGCGRVEFIDGHHEPPAWLRGRCSCCG